MSRTIEPIPVAIRNRVILTGVGTCFLITLLAAALPILVARNSDRIAKLQFLLTLTVPLMTFGVLSIALIVFKDMITMPKLHFPLNWTIPALWQIISIILVKLIQVQESALTTLPEVFNGLDRWSDPRFGVLMFVLQSVILSAIVSFSREIEIPKQD